MIRYQDDRSDRIEALKVRYLRNEISEAVFCASLHGVGGMTSEDIRYTLRDLDLPIPPQTFEDWRVEASRMWMRGYLC